MKVEQELSTFVNEIIQLKAEIAHLVDKKKKSNTKKEVVFSSVCYTLI
jgi:hypothetical protein